MITIVRMREWAVGISGGLVMAVALYAGAYMLLDWLYPSPAAQAPVSTSRPLK
jgi:hypothetical protein